MFTLINSLADLSFLNEELKSKEIIAIDTEFRRTTKTNMRLALLQVNDGEEIFIIDPLSIGHPEDKCSFLYCNSVKKIIHSCREDIEAIYSWTGHKLSNVFDTQIANSFLGGEHSISYQSLVEKKLGIKIDKGETRSNWIRRPLSDSQLKYATSDVEYLIHLFLLQEKKLVNSKKIEWFQEEISFLISNSLIEINHESCERLISRNQEEELLNKFNELVLSLSIDKAINPTLLFSKRSQKDFLRKAMKSDLHQAFQATTNWREKLLKEPLELLLH
mgnify:CR=1 FL=1